MAVDRDKVTKGLKLLREKGFSDEQIAIGIGAQMPGGAHPGAMSVYRWRTGRNKPREMYCWAVIEMARAQKEKE